MDHDPITAEAVGGLAAKLDALELTAGEQAALDVLFRRAAEGEAEVTGFGVVFEVETTYQQHVMDILGDHTASRPTEPKLAAGIGLFPSRSVWTDMRPRS